MSQPFSVFSRNGEICPLSDATVSLQSVEYAYGFGVYETIRVTKGAPLFVDDHTERLMHSAKEVGLEHRWGAGDVEKFIGDLISEIDEESFNIKILLIGGRSAEKAEMNILPLRPRYPEKKWFRDGVPVVTYAYERLFPQAKTLNMLGSYLAYRKAQEAGCYDALLIHSGGYLAEGTRTNLFGIVGRKLVTTPAEHVLPGVTRAHVITVAQKNGFEIEEEFIRPEDIEKYDALFLTSTSSKILPISSIDGVSCGEVTEELKELMDAFSVHLQGAS